MTILHFFIGMPGSKRKKWAETFANDQGIMLLIGDEVREEMEKIQGEGQVPNNLVFEESHRRIKKLLNSGKELVFDATNLYAKHRKQLIQMLKGHTVVAYYAHTSLEACIEYDATQEKQEGRAFYVQKFMTAEVPLKQEGFRTIYYNADKVSDEELAHYLAKRSELEETDEWIAWSKVFMQAGKPILDEIPEGPYRKIGYNNISAQIAFGVLYALDYSMDFIEEVVQLILYKNRFGKANDKGKENLKKQLGEPLFQKLEMLTIVK